jgi:hypothetical protein
VHTRIGGGLRVYLSRPWWSSGADELLGVVVRNQPWLTAPVDRQAGLLVSDEAARAADVAAEQILAAGLAVGRGSARVGPAERLLAGAASGSAAKPVVLPVRTSADDAQLTAHLAVVDGVGLSDQAVTALASTAALTGALDAFSGSVGIGALLGGLSGPLVTTWGTDPAWASTATDRGPYIHQFPLRSAVGTNISLPGQNEPAVVVGHTPTFDESRGLWACDLQLDAGAPYQPFVDLALVRYQPHSIAAHHASSVVRPGFAQVVPDRTAAMTPLRGSGSVAVSLRGPSGYNALGTTYLFGASVAALVDASHEVVAQVQTRPASGGDLDWRPLGDDVRLHASGDTLADVRWDAVVPNPDHPDGTQARLVVSEYELFETDPSQAETWVARPPGGFGESLRKPVGRRLVFATDFEL